MSCVSPRAWIRARSARIEELDMKLAPRYVGLQLTWWEAVLGTVPNALPTEWPDFKRNLPLSNSVDSDGATVVDTDSSWERYEPCPKAPHP